MACDICSSEDSQIFFKNLISYEVCNSCNLILMKKVLIISRDKDIAKATLSLVKVAAKKAVSTLEDVKYWADLRERAYSSYVEAELEFSERFVQVIESLQESH